MISVRQIESIRESIANCGYSFQKGLETNDIISVAESLGEVLADWRNTPSLREIRPELFGGANPNTLSSRYGMGAFPFHTDCAHWTIPARFVLLRCSNPGSGRRPTSVVDTWTWEWSTELVDALCNEVWARALKRPQLCNVAKRRGDQLWIRFDEACMKPITSGARYLLEEIRLRVEGAKKIDIQWTAGDTLILDNYRMLHARGMADRPDQDRVLQRILVGEGNETMGLRGFVA